MIKQLLFFVLVLGSTIAQKPDWQFNSSSNGKVPISWKATQQTASLVVDLNNDGFDDFVMAQRTGTPSLVWMQYSRSVGWREFAIDKDPLTIEAGGAFHDIDQDGDQDLVFGGDWQSNKVWWWENPYPYFNPNVAWKRYEIKNDGKNQHHDQAFGDFKQTGKSQLAFWNQGSKTLFLATIPANPKEKWAYEKIFEATNETKNWYAEGCDAADVDGDGYTDLIAANYWFKYENGAFKAIKFGEDGGRVVAAKFKTGKQMQIVVSPGDGKGRLMLYECNGPADEATSWKGRDLIGRELIHSHTLEVADINKDGNLDIFCGEMAKWSEKETKPDNPAAEGFILYGDGKVGFEKTTFQTGFGFHEARLADIDADGDIDVVSKPYNWQVPRLDVWLQNGTGDKLPSIGKTLESRFGLQLYSLRDYFKTDVKSTLAFVKELGIKEIELAGSYGYKDEDFRKELANYGITPYSSLMDFALFRDSINVIIKHAKAMNIKYVGCAWIPHKFNSFTREDATKAIDVFNKAGAALAKEGIGFFYHCHGYEFRPAPEGTLMDYIIQGTDKKSVSYEIDCYWAFHGGQDPALMMRKYNGRVLSIHIKDMKIGQATGELSGNTPLTSDVAIGTGQMDYRSILRAAIETNVKYFYMEDENADVKAHLPVSIKYLKGL